MGINWTYVILGMGLWFVNRWMSKQLLLMNMEIEIMKLRKMKEFRDKWKDTTPNSSSEES